MESRQVELSGTLAKFRFIEILQFLNTNKKTGELQLANGSEARASLFFDNGELVHVQTSEVEGRRAFDDVFCWLKGTFTFTGGVHSDRQTINAAIPSLILESQKRFEELKRLNERLPPGDAVFRLEPRPEVIPSFTGREWEIIALVDGRRSLRQICLRVSDEFEARKTIAILLEQGIISAESSRSRFYGLTPIPVSAVDFTGTRVFPSRVRTNLVLKLIDGRTAIGDLRAKLTIEDGDLVEDIKALYETHWISFSPPEDGIFLDLRGEL